ncbi:MAG: hypothetical protein OXG65_02310 [Chloroflexi bacterium]|nr:hypothetical protein [Chloroflexota bacterium]
MAEDRIRREYAIERLLVRLLEEAPDRWVRFDDWRFEYRCDRPTATHGSSRDVSEHSRTAVDAALRQAAEYRGLEPLNFVVRARSHSSQVNPGRVLAYRIEAFNRDGEVGEVDLIVGFAFPPADEIERIAALDVLTAQDGSPPRIPTRTRETQLAARLGAYTGRTSRFPSSADLLTIARYAPQVTCTADGLRRALDRVWPWTATPTWPLAVPAPPPWWADEYRRCAIELGLEPALAAGHAWAAALLDPILSGTVPPHATWNATDLRWDPPRRSRRSA